MKDVIKIDMAMVKTFEINLKDVQAMVKEYQKLTLKPDDKESYKACREALTTCVRNRTSIDKRRKELNTEDQNRIKKRNDVARQLTELISPAENHLSKLVKGEDNRVAEIKAEKARKEQARVEEIQEKIAEIISLTSSLHLQPSVNELNDILSKLESIQITPEIYQEFTPQASASRDEVRITITKALDARKEFELKEQALREENEKIEKEKKELKEKARAQKEAQQKIDADKEKLAIEKGVQKKLEEQAERDKEEMLKAEQEAQERVLQEEKDRERLEALKPDKDKLHQWFDQVEHEINKSFATNLNNTNAIDVHRKIIAKSDEFVRFARKKINDL